MFRSAAARYLTGAIAGLAFVGLAGLFLVPAQAMTDGSLGHTADDTVFPLAGAAFYGSPAMDKLDSPVAGIAAVPDGSGYWVVTEQGTVFSFGAAPSFGWFSTPKPVVAIASTPTGLGYWLATVDGGIYTFGDASFFGSLGDMTLSAPVAAFAAHPQGTGYWFATADGGVYTFGDAAFWGSPTDQTLSAPVVAIVPSPTGDGYTLVQRDGIAQPFGDGAGHTMPTSDGGTFLFGYDIVAAAATPEGAIELLDRSGIIYGATETDLLTFQQLRSLTIDSSGHMLAVSTAWAPAPGSATGTVSWVGEDVDGGVFSGPTACIELTGPVTRSAVGNGYRFYRLPAGTYGIAVNDCGAGLFVDQYRTITVASGVEHDESFSVQPGVAGTTQTASVVPGSPAIISTGGSPTSDAPTVATVSIPDGAATTETTVTISAQTTATVPTGFLALGTALQIEAPDVTGTMSAPLSLTLAFDRTVLGDTDYRAIAVTRDGELVADCAAPLSSLPCVADRQLRADGDAAVTVLTDHFSLWSGAAVIPATASGACILTQALVDAATAQSLCAKLGNPSPTDKPAQRNSIRAFTNHVRAQRGKSISTPIADTLIHFAATI